MARAAVGRLRLPTRPGTIGRMTEPIPGGRSRKRLLLFLLVPVALVAIAWIALVVALPPQRVQSIVRGQLAASLAREVRFKDVGVGLWPPVRLSVNDFAMAEPGGFGVGTALRTEAVRLNLDAFALLGRRLVVRRLEIVHPELHLVLRADGGSNLDGIGAPPGPAKPAPTMDLALDRIDITGGRVLLDDLAAKRRTMFALETSSSLSLTKSGAIRTAGTSHVRELRFGPLSAVRDADFNGSFAKLDWKIDHDAAYQAETGRLAIAKLGVVLGSTELGLSGIAELASKPPVVDMKARGTGVDLGEVFDGLASADARMLQGIRGTGKLDFDLSVQGPLEPGKRPPVSGTLAVRDGSFNYPGVPVGVEKLAVDVRLAPDSIVVPSLSARVSGQPLRATARITHLDDPIARFTLAGNLDMATMSRFIAEQDTKLDGRVTLDVSGQGRAKDPGSMALAGWAQLDNVSVVSPKLPKRIERLGGRITFSQERATIQGLHAEAGRSSFTIDASATRPLVLIAKTKPGQKPPDPSQIDFTIDSPYLDLAELVAPTPGGPLLPNARGKGKIAIRHFKSGRLDVADVNARLDLTPTAIVASPFSFNGYGGSVSGTANIDVERPEKPKVRMVAKVDSTRADQLLSAWTGAGKIVHGILGSDIELATDGLSADEVRRSLTAKGFAKVANGTLGPAQLFEAIAAFTRIPSYREVHFKDFTAPFKVENGRVGTGPAKLSGTYGDWLISGTTGFDGTLDYAVSITVPPELVAKLGARGALAVGALADPQGRVMLDLRVVGKAQSPRVSLDTKAMRDRLLGRAPSALLAPVLGDRTVSDTLNHLSQAAQDSMRAEGKRMQRALEDSLKRVARDALKKLFGGSKTDTSKH